MMPEIYVTIESKHNKYVQEVRTKAIQANDYALIALCDDTEICTKVPKPRGISFLSISEVRYVEALHSMIRFFDRPDMKHPVMEQHTGSILSFFQAQHELYLRYAQERKIEFVEYTVDILAHGDAKNRIITPATLVTIIKDLAPLRSIYNCLKQFAVYEYLPAKKQGVTIEYDFNQNALKIDDTLSTNKLQEMIREMVFLLSALQAMNRYMHLSQHFPKKEIEV